MNKSVMKTLYDENGQLHRENGPAERWPADVDRWYIRGELIKTEPVKNFTL